MYAVALPMRHNCPSEKASNTHTFAVACFIVEFMGVCMYTRLLYLIKTFVVAWSFIVLLQSTVLHGMLDITTDVYQAVVPLV